MILHVKTDDVPVQCGQYEGCWQWIWSTTGESPASQTLPWCYHV